MDSNDDISLVKAVFANGKVRVLFDESSPQAGMKSRLEIRNADQLAKTQNCFGDICVNSMVMDDRNAVGAVGAVFSNGKIGVDYPDIYNHGRRAGRRS